MNRLKSPRRALLQEKGYPAVLFMSRAGVHPGPMLLVCPLGSFRCPEVPAAMGEKWGACGRKGWSALGPTESGVG